MKGNTLQQAETNRVDSADLQQMAALLTKLTPYDGFFQLQKDYVHVVRASKTASEKTYLLARPSICIVPQGAKTVSLTQGGIDFEENESTLVVYSAEVPINLAITQASAEKPYFCLMIPLDAKKLGSLILKVFPHGVPKAPKLQAVYVGDADANIVKATVRALQLIEQQQHTELLVPLMIEEILIRLLLSPMGPAIVQIAIADSHAEKVAKAISWLKENFAQPIKIEELAKLTGMSVSSFHTHFKAITSMSPLQFQKTVRLQQARSLMRAQMMDVSSAAYEVGYASTSQFSREYARAFGVPPSKDVGRASAA
ncbi:AraC family transcriptional regulator [Shewanella avicenniae]|uniref:AraC family transcriptional regulator n=1 Tax=Shewanella avicenniae TaxID=2814294 RepID=A0ABX7QVI9_9GAMM|nr:AraC family transcriptional regulator [Shewanella avicenniae]QSX34655.1 AraC family transcriptional regulator [Shewanella avicenniae]